MKKLSYLWDVTLGPGLSRRDVVMNDATLSVLKRGDHRWVWWITTPYRPGIELTDVRRTCLDAQQAAEAALPLARRIVTKLLEMRS